MDKQDNVKNKNLMDEYYKLIVDAHVCNILNDLEEKRDDIDKIEVSEALDEWFDDKIKSQYNRSKRIIAFRHLSSKIAVAVLALIVTTSIITCTVKAVRTEVVNFFVRTYDTFSEIIVNKTEEYDFTKNIDWEEYYYPTYLPKGYSYIRSLGSGSIKVIIFGDNENKIVFNQCDNGTNIQIDTEDSIITEIKVKDMNGLLIEKDDRVIIFWYDNEHNFSIQGFISKRKIIKIAESLEKK